MHDPEKQAAPECWEHIEWPVDPAADPEALTFEFSLHIPNLPAGESRAVRSLLARLRLLAIERRVRALGRVEPEFMAEVIQKRDIAMDALRRLNVAEVECAMSEEEIAEHREIGFIANRILGLDPMGRPPTEGVPA